MSNRLICVAPETVKTNFTMCPNWIYETVLLEESHSVAKIVLFVNRNTTGRLSNTGQDGKRVEAVQASYSWIAKAMNMSLRAVGDAVRVALAKGYIIQVKPGHIGGEGAWYSLNWNWAETGTGNETQAETNLANSVVATYVKPTELEQNLPVKAEKVWQDLPVNLEQSLPVIINKANLNKTIEIKQTVSSDGETDSSGVVSSKRKGSALIGRLITDFTRELGDTQSLTLANVGRVINLWNKSSLTEQDFVACMQAARQKTATGAIQKKRQNNSDYTNRMPYFFSVLTNLLTDYVGGVASTKPEIAQLETAKTAETLVVAEIVEPVQPAPQPTQTAACELTDRLEWLSSPKKRALEQAELQAVATSEAYFELKFAQSWQRNLFTEWEKEQITYALAEVKGQALASGTVLFS